MERKKLSENIVKTLFPPDFFLNVQNRMNIENGDSGFQFAPVFHLEFLFYKGFFLSTFER